MKIAFLRFFPVFLIALLGAFPAFADNANGSTSAAHTLGDVFCNAANNISPFIDVFNWLAYVAGGYFVVQGVLRLRDHHEHGHNQHPLHKVFALFTGGSLLLALPSLIGTLIDSLFYGGIDSSNGLTVSSCSGIVGSASSGGAVPLDAIMTNMINNIEGPLTFLVQIVAVTLGVFLIVRGLMKASKYGTDPRTHSITHITANLVIGTVLVVLGQSLTTIMASVTGGDGGHLVAFESLSWTSLDSAGGDTTQFKAAMKAALTFFQLVGLISFVRGWNVIRNSIEGVGQATFAQGLTHIIGGVLALNIFWFMQVMDATFGTQFVS